MDSLRRRTAPFRRTVAVLLAAAVAALFAIPAGAQAAVRPQLGGNYVNIPLQGALHPRGITFDPNTHLAYVANENSDSVTVINEAARAPLGPNIALPVGSHPEGIGWDGNTNTIWVADNSGSVSIINEATRAVVNLPIPPINNVNAIPSRIAVDPVPAAHTVFVGLWLGYVIAVNDQTFAMREVYTSNSKTHIQLGAFDSRTGLLVASAWDVASVYEINPAGPLGANVVATVSNLASVPTVPELATAQVGFFTAETCCDQITAYPEGGNIVRAPFIWNLAGPANFVPADFAADAPTGFVYAAAAAANAAAAGITLKINQANGAVAGIIPVGVAPYGVIVDPAIGPFGTVFVTNSTSNTVTAFDA